jgi:hypothetical protein
MLFGIIGIIAAIGVFCWLIFTLAVYALPFFAGITIGSWAFSSGAGWLGAIIVGLIGAAATFGLGQFLFAFVRPAWARITIGVAFAAPAAFAGYHAVHGIAQHAMPSEVWRVVFSVIGAVAVGATAWMRISAAGAIHTDRGLARG